MASAIAHFIVGAALALPAIESRTIREVLPRWAIPVLLRCAGGVSRFGHVCDARIRHPLREFLRPSRVLPLSVLSVLLAGSLAAMAAGRRSSRAAVWLGLLWAGCAVTHPLLDALTDGGSGVML